MSLSVRGACRGRGYALAAAVARCSRHSASAQMELKIIAPAAPGGGWDQTARSMQQALTAEKLVKSAQVINIAGAGGTVGLAQFVNGARATATADGQRLRHGRRDPAQQVAGHARPGDADRAPDRRDAGDRGAGQFADQERQGSRRGGEEGRRQGHLRRRLGRRRRPHHGGAVRRRGRRRRRRRSTTCRSPAAASRSPPSSAAG